MTDPHVVGADPASAMSLSPGRIFNQRSFQSGGGGMVGTAGDFMAFLEAIRTGQPPILTRETLRAATSNQIGDLSAGWTAGWHFCFLGAVLADPAQTDDPRSPGTVAWAGSWGNHWFIDPRAGRSVVCFTNTALAGMDEPFVTEIRNAIYAVA